MAFDGIVTKAIASELQQLSGARVDKIFQPNSNNVIIGCYINGKKLVIFAGACQSYFEAIISAGANFASSPARILIDFLDPLVVAEKIALTEKYKYITIDDIAYELRDGRDGIGGIGANGKMTKCLIINKNKPT